MHPLLGTDPTIGRKIKGLTGPVPKFRGQELGVSVVGGGAKVRASGYGVYSPRFREEEPSDAADEDPYSLPQIRLFERAAGGDGYDAKGNEARQKRRVHGLHRKSLSKLGDKGLFTW